MKVIKLGQIESTNGYAKQNIEDLDNKTIIHSLRQTCGRGRLNRSWVDFGEGNLFVSFVLKPSNDYKSVYSNLTQYTSVILCRLLKEYGVNPMIKWPNDVMIDGKRKISGILCETVMEGMSLKGIIVGVGVNLNATKEAVFSVKDRVATSLNLEINKSVDLDSFLNNFSDKFFESYEDFLKNGFVSIMDEYVERNCSLNKDVNVNVLNNVKSGFAKGINQDGNLLLRTNENKDVVLSIGDIL